ncbi:phospholipase [Leuconostoc pseudomesenteroides]|nr:phospholipase [Leuconostoc pseudomesenteroides]OQJ70383.1 phospholipase [Leuconostoc pseudomesenteroides]OQJ79654.1 phospholipase [Leuconostoc pseudomesenteroides]OQJ81124.1 phospholipase [Leuconostoc pseudomesenteroides]ORI51605.1 phospholipase [Leuconostoc pseudomesenteroides]
MIKQKLDDVHYLFIAGNPDLPTVVLLHGTGGDENDLVPIAKYLAPNHPILAIRGRVLENGYHRFFERYAEGKFNLVSLNDQTAWLVKSVTELLTKYDLNTSSALAIGFSNGANIALHALLTHRETPFKNVMALHAMQLTSITEPAKLQGNHVFLSHGNFDPIVSRDNFDALVDNLAQAKALVTVFRLNQSHVISSEELQAAKIWLKANDIDEA